MGGVSHFCLGQPQMVILLPSDSLGLQACATTPALPYFFSVRSEQISTKCLSYVKLVIHLNGMEEEYILSVKEIKYLEKLISSFVIYV
jgi:hypothetical protein